MILVVFGPDSAVHTFVRQLEVINYGVTHELDVSVRGLVAIQAKVFRDAGSGGLVILSFEKGVTPKDVRRDLLNWQEVVPVEIVTLYQDEYNLA